MPSSVNLALHSNCLCSIRFPSEAIMLETLSLAPTLYSICHFFHFMPILISACSLPLFNLLPICLQPKRPSSN